MISKSASSGAAASTRAGAANLAEAGKEQAEAALDMQKDLLGVYDEIGRAWLERTRTEIELWSDLATRISGTRSVPEAMSAYQEFVGQRMQMAADDARRMAADCQALMTRMTRSLPGGWPGGST